MSADQPDRQHLSRETVLAELVESLSAVLESALGPDIANSCLSDIGVAVGVRVDRDFKRISGIDRSLHFSEFCLLVDEVLINLYPRASIIDVTDDSLRIEVLGGASLFTLLNGRDFSEMGTSIFGAVSAINFGFGKVCASAIERDGEAIRQIVVFTSDTPEARELPGDEYYPEVVAAFGSVETQLKVVEENRILREQLQESAVEYRTRNRQIAALAAIARIVSQSFEPSEILSSGLQMLLDAIGVEVGAVFRINDDTQVLELSYAIGISPDYARQILFDHILPPHSPARGERWDTLLEAGRHSPPDWQCGEFECYASAPMRNKERPIGVVLILGRLRRAFIPLEMELLVLVANELGVGLENIRLYNYLGRQMQRMTNLREISAQLNRCVTMDQVLDLAAESLTRTLGFDRVGMFLVNEEENCLERMRGTDEHGSLIQMDRLRIPLRPESGTLARAVLEKRPLHVLRHADEADIDLTSEEASGLANLHISAFARVPLRAENNVVGAISVDNMLHQRPITDEDLSMLMIFGNQVAIAIGNVRYTEALQRSSEQLRRVDAVRSQFVSLISHELRSPLHRIRNASALILDADSAPQDRARFARMIIKSTDYLTGLVNNLLTESRIEQASLRVEPAPLPLARLANDLVQELRSATLPPDQQLIVDVPEDLVVLADSPYLKLILGNLLSNASKASDRSGRIEIHAESSGRYARVCVRDYGVGIPYDRQELIFDRYASFGPDDGSQANTGVGLGLHICRSLVDAHGGRLWVTSQPGQGSEFCFTLPMVDDDGIV